VIKSSVKSAAVSISQSFQLLLAGSVSALRSLFIVKGAVTLTAEPVELFPNPSG
jgi:hypothetical protein